jgi:AraC-like DNA-binding protein
MRSSQIVDVLTYLLQRSRARGAAFAHTTVHGDWGVRFPAGPRISVHAVVAGEAHRWADAPDRSLRLVPGDIVLVRESTPHQMASAPGARCIPFADLPLDPTGRRRVAAGDGPSTVFFCGAYDFEGDLCRSTLEALPATFRLRPEPGSTLRATMDLLGREMLRDEPGQQALLDRLLDVALVQVLREHFTARDAHAPAWFRASSDPHVGAALRALHADPARQWTVADLAAAAALSRSAFARRFTELLGEAPLTYLTQWRMALARERLRDSDQRLAAIAQSLGYGSEFAFAAAFKRHHGAAPGRWRTAKRAAA